MFLGRTDTDSFMLKYTLLLFSVFVGCLFCFVFLFEDRVLGGRGQGGCSFCLGLFPAPDLKMGR